MDYCPTCRRHLNGALACPGCGAYSDSALKAEFQARYQNPYQSAVRAARRPEPEPEPASASVPGGRGGAVLAELREPERPAEVYHHAPAPTGLPPAQEPRSPEVLYPAPPPVETDFPPAYGGYGYGHPPQAPVYVPTPSDFEGEPFPAEQGEGPPRYEDSGGYPDATAFLDVDGLAEDVPDESDDLDETEADEEDEGPDGAAGFPPPEGRSARRAAAGRGSGQSHRQSRRKRRTAALTAVGLVVGGLVAWEGGVSVLSLGESGHAPVAAPDAGPTDSAAASASASPSAPASAGPSANGVLDGGTHRPSASESAKASASAHPSATHPAQSTPTGSSGGGSVGGANTTAASSHPSASSPSTPSASPSCTAHFLWWCTG